MIDWVAMPHSFYMPNSIKHLSCTNKNLFCEGNVGRPVLWNILCPTHLYKIIDLSWSTVALDENAFESTVLDYREILVSSLTSSKTISSQRQLQWKQWVTAYLDVIEPATTNKVQYIEMHKKPPQNSSSKSMLNDGNQRSNVYRNNRNRTNVSWLIVHQFRVQVQSTLWQNPEQQSVTYESSAQVSKNGEEEEQNGSIKSAQSDGKNDTPARD